MFVHRAMKDVAVLLTILPAAAFALKLAVGIFGGRG